jgi:hypothetical protein
LRFKRLLIGAIAILIVGAWLLLGQRTYNPPSTVESDSTEESSQVDGESTSVIGPHSDVTSSIHSDLTRMPSVTPVPNDLQGVASATGTAPNNLIVTTPSPVISTSDLTEGLIGDQSTPPGRLAPDVLTDALQFSNIRIYENKDSGVFSGQANVKNLGTTFLNQLVLSWKILDSTGQVLDQGQVTWPNLAPNETATITFVGKAVFLERWNRIEFAYFQ